MRLDTNRRTHRAILVVEEKQIALNLGYESCDFFASCQFEVEAEFTYLPEQQPVLTGPWEDADPGAPPEVEIMHLRVVEGTVFGSEDTVTVLYSMITPGDVTTDEPGLLLTARAGRDILQFFTTSEIGKFEDELLTRAITGDLND